MNDPFSAEHEELRAVVRRLLRAKSPEEAVRRTMATGDGFDRDLWAQMAEQLGLQGLLIPESLGGAGDGFHGMAVVLEEMGSALLCGPFLASAVLATTALVESGDIDAQQMFLPGMAAGTLVATVAVSELSGSWDHTAVEATAERQGTDWRISGVKSFVLDGCVADLILVAARTDAGLSLFAAAGESPGLTRSPLTVLDQTRRQARLDFDHVPARLVGAPGGVVPVLKRVLDLAMAGLAAEQVGGARACLAMSVDYAKTRYQFGRPIGSFQAIKHKCADLLIEVESAKSAANLAADAAAWARDDLSLMASLAKATCSDAYMHAAAENIQVHGGIGFTWEHSAHLYFRRAKSSGLLFGDPAYHRRLAADIIGI